MYQRPKSPERSVLSVVGFLANNGITGLQCRKGNGFLRPTSGYKDLCYLQRLQRESEAGTRYCNAIKSLGKEKSL